MYPIHSLQGSSKIRHNVSHNRINQGKQNLSFQNILEEQIQQEQKLQFSKHAALRLQQRKIQLSKEQLQKLEQGIETAKSKGIKDSLMVLENMAFVINIKNKTVVTALDYSKAEETVFTHIDGALIL